MNTLAPEQVDQAFIQAMEFYLRNSGKPGKTTRHKVHGKLTVIYAFDMGVKNFKFKVQFAAVEGLLITNGFIPISIVPEQAETMHRLLNDLYEEESVFYGRVEVGPDGSLYYRQFQYYPYPPGPPETWATFIHNTFSSAMVDMGRAFDAIMRRETEPPPAPRGAVFH